MAHLLIVIAILIVLVLAVVAAALQYKLHQQTQERKALMKEQQAKSDAQRARINKSIQIIAQALGTDDISLTEGSIRISVLLDSLSVEESVREEFAPFYQLAQATSHIPILDAWKALPTKHKLKYDRERNTQEQFYEKTVLEAAAGIRDRTF